ncbi:hypothetical protein ACIQM0_28675 [Streptomyces sp. NPDC091387]|uniref:hypothetical protein n=1 Tax=Streptomyces sp. NPDC091387 TaxID=3365998 RepID=UPI00382E60BC
MAADEVGQAGLEQFGSRRARLHDASVRRQHLHREALAPAPGFCRAVLEIL